jgi:hypothetical protein
MLPHLKVGSDNVWNAAESRIGLKSYANCVVARFSGLQDVVSPHLQMGGAVSSA